MDRWCISLLLGILLDFLWGDPVWLYHPVRMIGNWISFLETRIRNVFPKTDRGAFLGGMALVFLVLFVSVGLPWFLLWVVAQWNKGIATVLEGFWIYQLLATKSLKDAGKTVKEALEQKGLEGGRKAVSYIVGRDTGELTEEGVLRATVETIAENTTDGVLAPLCFILVGGAVGGFFYKAVNTMDSMIGYRNERYEYFGRAAACLDDICNWIPARIAVFFLWASSIFCGLQAKEGIRIWKRDRFCHKSPNSAQTEAFVAGALGVQLAGDAYYFGKLVKKPTIGDAKRPIERKDIDRTNQLLYGATLVAVVVFIGIKYGILRWFG